MTTPAKKALEELGGFKPKTIDTLGEPIKMAAWAYRNISTIRAALKLMDEVQSGRLEKPLTSYWTTERDSAVSWNDCLDRLKQIAGE